MASGNSIASKVFRKDQWIVAAELSWIESVLQNGKWRCVCPSVQSNLCSWPEGCKLQAASMCITSCGRIAEWHQQNGGSIKMFERDNYILKSSRKMHNVYYTYQIFAADQKVASSKQQECAVCHVGEQLNGINKMVLPSKWLQRWNGAAIKMLLSSKCWCHKDDVTGKLMAPTKCCCL